MSEAEEFGWARELLQTDSQARSLEAEIMDWADDIAYAVHDMEDFYRAGLIPLDKLANDQVERDWFIGTELDRNQKLASYDPDNLATVFNEIARIAPLLQTISRQPRRSGTAQELHVLARGSLSQGCLARG